MNNNPQGHNQYTKNDSKSGSGSKQSTQPRNADGEYTKKSDSSRKAADGRSGHANNPEGHNQYTKKN